MAVASSEVSVTSMPVDFNGLIGGFELNSRLPAFGESGGCLQIDRLYS